MNIWTTGIIEAEANSAFFQTRKYLQCQLDALSSIIDAGLAVDKIRVVFVVNKDEVSEFQRFSKKAKVLDIRVKIPYDDFCKSSVVERVEIFIRALTSSINKVDKFEQVEFDRDKLIEAIAAIPLPDSP